MGMFRLVGPDPTPEALARLMSYCISVILFAFDAGQRDW